MTNITKSGDTHDIESAELPANVDTTLYWLSKGCRNSKW